VSKAMLFIDGTWLYSNTPKLADSYGKPDYHVDFGKLPQVLADVVGQRMGGTDVDVVRTHLFGSYAANYDLLDDDSVQRRLDFFSLLREEYHYEVEVFPINFRGRRLRRMDRDPRDSFEPKEKCVDISLATAILFYAAIPNAYDIAIVVLGDQDFKPVLQHVRRLGKRVAIASIRYSCAPDFADARDEARVKDFDIIWLEDLLVQLELKYERHQLRCESPNHVGDRNVWTTFHPRKNQRFYCDVCRTEFSKQKQEAQQQYVSSGLETAPPADGLRRLEARQVLSGDVKKKVAERGFGFIGAEDGRDYFFHLTDLEGDLNFDLMSEGEHVVFEVKREPSPDKSGAAQHVRRAVRADRVEAGNTSASDPFLMTDEKAPPSL
jgi:cold shock CspA family protein